MDLSQVWLESLGRLEGLLMRREVRQAEEQIGLPSGISSEVIRRCEEVFVIPEASSFQGEAYSKPPPGKLLVLTESSPGNVRLFSLVDVRDGNMFGVHYLRQGLILPRTGTKTLDMLFLLRISKADPSVVDGAMVMQDEKGISPVTPEAMKRILNNNPDQMAWEFVRVLRQWTSVSEPSLWGKAQPFGQRRIRYVK